VIIFCTEFFILGSVLKEDVLEDAGLLNNNTNIYSIFISRIVMIV